ncbi:MAG: hypothetical protein JO060_03845, partial [Candidatus Eremiobacteraeota bacterium]|nr:hypothetical protein [Candidatus Eremiobacteraeota bacterium]
MKPFATALTIALAACTALVMLLPHCADAAPSGLTPLGGRPTFWIGPSRHGTSWMARTAMHNTLLYVSDALSNDVNVYSY